jgi:succinate dehydrogenase / fumarate reductase, iron-sulfur subunit
MTEKKTIRVKIYRSPEKGEGSGRKGKFVEYEIPYTGRMTVLNACTYVYENFDRCLSFYYSCRIGKCLGCLMDIDGKTKLACTTLAKDGMKIGPAKQGKVIKDLFVDFKAK